MLGSSGGLAQLHRVMTLAERCANLGVKDFGPSQSGKSLNFFNDKGDIVLVVTGVEDAGTCTTPQARVEWYTANKNASVGKDSILPNSNTPAVRLGAVRVADEQVKTMFEAEAQAFAPATSNKPASGLKKRVRK